MKTQSKNKDSFGARSTLKISKKQITIYRLDKLEKQGIGNISKLPYSIKILLESVLRQCDEFEITSQDIVNLAKWNAKNPSSNEVPYKPARVILQDFTGVPVAVDLASMRAEIHKHGGNPSRINPVIPVDLVIDHSIQVDKFGSTSAMTYNTKLEFKRNKERYEFLKWCQKAFDNFSVVPPATGIVHQVNLEYLAKVVQTRKIDGKIVSFPDTLVGTDSHTTMINGLGIVGWGVGGIEAEAAMLGQPIYIETPQVIGFKLIGELPEGATATDLVLTVTQMLRAKGVVGKFVEYFGPGVSKLSLADRATISNMSPEYGATIGFFPIDEETLNYLRGTGRSKELVDLVERYAKEQGLFRTDSNPDPEYTDTLELDLNKVESSLAGPKRPHDRVPLRQAKRNFWQAITKSYKKQIDNPAIDTEYLKWLNDGATELPESFTKPQNARNNLFSKYEVPAEINGKKTSMSHGAVVISAITSCTNTSNPSVLIGAGLLAKKAVEKGLTVQPYVKTSLAPGSRVVTSYLEGAGLMPYLQKLGFHLVGYGCTTCIGNSGPLPEEVSKVIKDNDLVVAAVLSGNRNFEGRVHPLTRANYLASPPLVVAYALAGTMDIDFNTEPIGYDKKGNPVYLKNIWPTQEEIRNTIQKSLKPKLFKTEYKNVSRGNESWNKIVIPKGKLYKWDDSSTYIKNPPFFESLGSTSIKDIKDARVLALLGDTITTDHISPAGDIPENSPGGKYLIEHKITKEDFNSYGARRGNHEVMMRGTFANIRLKNLLIPGSEGGITIYLGKNNSSGEQMSIYDASMNYKKENIPLIIIAGKEYGSGSSRDWAAKGVMLLSVKAVIAESYERIHRSNLVGMGVLPLEFKPGENAQSLGLTGFEVYNIEGIDENLKPKQELTVRARGADAKEKVFKVISRIDLPVEIKYYKHGGILQAFLGDTLK